MPGAPRIQLVWLWLYAGQVPPGIPLAPLLGILSVGLHEPDVSTCSSRSHFARGSVWQKRWGWTAYYALMYLAALASGPVWRWVRPDCDFFGNEHAARISREPAGSPLQMTECRALFRGKASPPACCGARAAPLEIAAAIIRDAAFSSAPCRLLPPFQIDQGHGGGYRYLYPTWKLDARLAVAGCPSLREALGAAKFADARGRLARRFRAAALSPARLAGGGIHPPVRHRRRRAARGEGGPHRHLAHGRLVRLDPSATIPSCGERPIAPASGPANQARLQLRRTDRSSSRPRNSWRDAASFPCPALPSHE